MIKAELNKNDNTVYVNLDGDILQLTTELVIIIAKINEENNIISPLKKMLDIISESKARNIPIDNVLDMFYSIYLDKGGDE